MELFSPDCMVTTAFMFFVGVLFAVNLYMINSVLKYVRGTDKTIKEEKENRRGKIPVYIDDEGNIQIQDEGRLNPNEDLHKWSD